MALFIWWPQQDQDGLFMCRACAATSPQMQQQWKLHSTRYLGFSQKKTKLCSKGIISSFWTVQNKSSLRNSSRISSIASSIKSNHRRIRQSSECGIRTASKQQLRVARIFLKEFNTSWTQIQRLQSWTRYHISCCQIFTTIDQRLLSQD